MATDPFIAVLGTGRGDTVILPGSPEARMVDALRSLWGGDLDPALALIAAEVESSGGELLPQPLKALAALVARPLIDRQHQRWPALVGLTADLGLRPPEVAAALYLERVEHDAQIALNTRPCPDTAGASAAVEGASITLLANIAADGAAGDSVTTAQRYLGAREFEALEQETTADIGVSAKDLRRRLDRFWWAQTFRLTLRRHLTDGEPLDVEKGFRGSFRGAAIKLAEGE